MTGPRAPLFSKFFWVRIVMLRYGRSRMGMDRYVWLYLTKSFITYYYLSSSRHKREGKEG